MPDSTLFPIHNQASPTLSPTGSARTYIQASATGAATALTVTLAAAAGKTTWINGFSLTGDGATGASVVTVTLTGISTTMSYIVEIPAGATNITPDLFVEFAEPIPASAPNTAIVINVPSFGAGNTAVACNAHGFQQ